MILMVVNIADARRQLVAILWARATIGDGGLRGRVASKQQHDPEAEREAAHFRCYVAPAYHLNPDDT